MWISIAIALFGAFVGVCVRSRSGALFLSLAAAGLANYGLTALETASPYFLTGSAAGRRVAAELSAVTDAGTASLVSMAAAAAAGALIGVILARLNDGQSREWDPDRARKRRRRRPAADSGDSRIQQIING